MPEIDIPYLHALYREGTDPANIVDQVYAEIERIADPGIFIAMVEHAAARKAAEALPPFDPAAMPLWGVPFAVKDNIDVTGLPTTAACKEFAYTPKRSATAVERLVAAGAILIGKTNLDQFATGLVGVRTPYPVPKNACDPTLVPGGSSSGSGVAVALGLVSFALGTDTAGSGRVPAALNNIVGLKPTRGAISAAGVVPACRALDCVSIFAGTVQDAWTVFGVANGGDDADAFSRTVALGTPALPPALRVAVPEQKSRIFGSREAETAFDAALGLLPEVGVETKMETADLSLFFETARLLYEGASVAERYQAIRDFIEAQPTALHPVTRQIIEGARQYSAADAFGSIYRLVELARATAPFWRDFDVLIVPSIPDACTLAEAEAEPVAANSRLGTYTNFVNLLDLCAVAVPGPFRSDGRPSGVTLIAPAGRDALLAALAERLHQLAHVPIGATGLALPATEIQKGPPPGMIEIAVVGAHLSGMALNHELMVHGASFVRAAVTAPAYRLFALDSGPPERPGLVRVEERGASIDVEVWALSPEDFGDFVAKVAPPHAIGTVKLADGTAVKGFLCEPIGTAGARDITSFGGWRAYIASRD